MFDELLFPEPATQPFPSSVGFDSSVSLAMQPGGTRANSWQQFVFCSKRL
jgi:hypothetical protein